MTVSERDTTSFMTLKRKKNNVERDATSFITSKRKKNNVLIGLISDIVSMMIQIVSFQVFEEKSILLSSQHNHSHVFPMLCELVGD